MFFLKTFAVRLVSSLPLIVVISIMVFAILRMLPADPIAMLLPPNATVADAARLREAYGLDQPIYVQYLFWISGILQGNFGASISLHQPVAGLILPALPATIELVFAGAVLGILLGVASGILLFVMRGRAGEYVGDVVVLMVFSLPELLWAILLLILFGVVLAVLPFMGRMEPGFQVEAVTGFLFLDTLIAGNFAAFVNVASHMVLPALALAAGLAPMIARVVRAALLEVEREDYVQMASIRGLGPLRILWNYQFRNAAVPTVSLIGVQVAFLFGGTMLVEVVFSYPGLGNLMVEAVKAQDLPLIQAAALTYCGLVLVVNALVDASYALLNPKLRNAA
jgi:ABC-type dipeptide/oligopeptide/nickel transport system permease component